MKKIKRRKIYACSIILLIMLFLNTIFLLAELPLFLLSPIHYIMDSWNLLDITRIFFMYVYSFMYVISSAEENSSQQIALGIVILSS